MGIDGRTPVAVAGLPGTDAAVGTAAANVHSSVLHHHEPRPAEARVQSSETDGEG